MKLSKQHLLKWQPLPRRSLIKNNLSPHNQTKGTSQTDKPFNKKNNPDKVQSNGQQMRNHHPWKQMWKIYKDRRKHYVVLHEWNQGNCTNTSIARCRSCVEEDERERPMPTTCWSVNGDRTHDTKITRQMKTACFLKMAYFSLNNLEKQVVSNTIKFSSQRV